MNISSVITDRQDKDGMLRRALERIIQLYTDKSHFIYELLQNAEDASAHNIRFCQFSDHMEVLHDGKPFTVENLQGLCDIGKSDKVANLNQIGEFGVGFKSVFGICDTVRLFSTPENYKGQLDDDCSPFAVEIHDFTKPTDIPYIEVERGFTTKFEFPFCVGFSFSGFKTINQLSDALSLRLQNLGITTLLFMRNLESIEFEIKTDKKSISGGYLLEKREINDHLSLISAYGESHAKAETLSYLKFSKLLANENAIRTVDIAYPVSIGIDGTYTFKEADSPYISVYFPTETESKLKFIVQGPFRTTPNRSSVPCDDAENAKLAEVTALLLRESIIELRDLGMLNLSFLKLLPLDESVFRTYDLFEPLYESAMKVLSCEKVLPCKTGGYVKAESAKIARNQTLTTLFDDELLSELIQDGIHYHWLPIVLTETNKQYKALYEYMTDELQISVVRPEDLKTYFNSNPSFLKARDNGWIINLYRLYESIPNLFNKSRYGTNMLLANLVKTSSGEFVAPFRKDSEGNYLQNVFLPSKKEYSNLRIAFVDNSLFRQCQKFFEDVLQLLPPKEYDLFIEAFKKRNSEGNLFSNEEHIEDIKSLIHYLNSSDYGSDVSSVIRKRLLLVCRIHGSTVTANPYKTKVLFPKTKGNISIEAYYRNITDNYYVDMDFYSSRGITYDDLSKLGVSDRMVVNSEVTTGTYYSGSQGGQPKWTTYDDFRWKLTFDKIDDVLLYISNNPSAPDSIAKSQVIFRLLQENEKALIGTVYIGGYNISNIEHAQADIVSTLSRSRTGGYRANVWNGKWLYTESNELVSPGAISKHDLSKAIYGSIQSDSELYSILGFKKDAMDHLEEAISDYDELPSEKKNSYFELELKRRYGISDADLQERFGRRNLTTGNADYSFEPTYEFPVVQVKNWESLKKHATEMFAFAQPVQYEYLLRRIRTSNPNTSRAYLMGQYKAVDAYKYACQMCHDFFPNIESCQIEEHPQNELEPMNICLCPNCATKFRELRRSKYCSSRLIKQLKGITREEIDSSAIVEIEIEINYVPQTLWFTQTHIAEISELYALKEAIERNTASKPDNSRNVVVEKKKAPANETTSVKRIDVPSINAGPTPIAANGIDFTRCLGKKVRHKTEGCGIVKSCTDQHIEIAFTQGKRSGETIKYGIAVCASLNLLEIIES